MTMKRRDALKTIGAMAGAAGAAKVLPGCGDGSGLPPGIHHMVVVMMENRSYDHLLGARKLMGLGGDGLVATMSNLDTGGTERRVYEASFNDVCVPDPPHGWSASRNQFATGANSGFITAHEASHGVGNYQPMQYMTRDLVPVSWALADGFASCDRYFCSVLGPTWPNRMYWHSGSSNGIMSNDFPSGGFTWPSIHHRLDDVSVGWKYYYMDIPVLAIVDTLDSDGRLFLFEDFLRDAMSGNLAPVTYIDPGFGYNDDHPPHHPIYGQQFISAIYNALAAGPLWEHCLLVVTYDENGGFFDHVPPPTTVDEFASTGFDQMGFRVPTLVAGPYVKQGHVSSVTMDHCSVLKHIENNFGTAPLNARVTAANDLSDCLDLAALAAGTPRAPVTIPAVEIDEESIRAECRGAAEMQHDVLRMADEHPRLFKRWDRRDTLFDQAMMIGDFLDSVNAGRIIRRK